MPSIILHKSLKIQAIFGSIDAGNNYTGSFESISDSLIPSKCSLASKNEWDFAFPTDAKNSRKFA